MCFITHHIKLPNVSVPPQSNGELENPSLCTIHLNFQDRKWLQLRHYLWPVEIFWKLWVTDLSLSQTFWSRFPPWRKVSSKWTREFCPWPLKSRIGFALPVLKSQSRVRVISHQVLSVKWTLKWKAGIMLLF